MSAKEEVTVGSRRQQALLVRDPAQKDLLDGPATSGDEVPM